VRVAVAMSGGVDSSVAAALLQAQGHDVVGVTLQQWPRDDMESRQARRVLLAQRGGGRASRSFAARHSLLLLEPREGVRRAGHRTVSPRLPRRPDTKSVREVQCLRALRPHARPACSTSGSTVSPPATTRASSNGSELHTAVDDAKDQSYMLYHLDRERLAHILFPLGGMTKGEVREQRA